MPNWTSLVRLLRRRLVLGIIFGLSLAYCAISLLSHEKLGNSLRGIREGPNGELSDDRDAPLVDYNENGDEETFRGSAKILAWQSPSENNYEAGNDDAGDINRDSIDGNGTFVVARMCRNSVQGKALIVDERGFVCSRSELLSTGCCDASEKTRDENHNVESPSNLRRKRYSCETCNPQGCCAVYEYCVSCCLQPGKRRGKKEPRSTGERDRRDNSRGRDEDAIRPRLRNLDRFQACLAACRTSSASVRHENTYKDPDSKHCYTQYQRSSRRDENMPKNNNGDNSIVVVTSSSTLRLFIQHHCQIPCLLPLTPRLTSRRNVPVQHLFFLHFLY